MVIERATDGAAASRGRAPARALSLDRRPASSVGLDFGHPKVRVAVADLAYAILAEEDHALEVDHAARGRPRHRRSGSCTG